MRYEVSDDGTLSNGTVFADLTLETGDEALDGLKVDRAGTVFVSGPGGVWVFDPSGSKLGLLKFPELPANFTWGNSDGRTLYLTARTGLYRLRGVSEGGSEAGATGSNPLLRLRQR
jgi:sugar lactone lactonase YvrE